MIVRTPAAVSIAAFLSTTVAHAQTHPGMTFDETVHSSRGANPSNDTSTTSVLHFTSSHGNVRIDVEGTMPEAGKILGGSRRSTMLFTDSGATVTFINIDQKQYISVKPVAMMEGAKKMMESMGGQIVVDSSATKLTLDSLGPGPVIDNHPTLRYRLTTSLRITMAMMGRNSVIDQHSVDDIYAATDLGDMTDVTASFNKLADIGQSVGLAPGFMERAKALERKIPGLPVRITKVQTIKTDTRTRTVTHDMVVSNIRRVQVPDSAFAIPAGYAPLSMPTAPTSSQ